MAIADLKQLNCDWEDRDSFFSESYTFLGWMTTSMDALPIGMRLEDAENMLAEYKADDLFTFLVPTMEEKVSSLKSDLSSCKTSDILLHYSFTLDASTLNNADSSNVEFTYSGCAVDPGAVEVSKLSSTPNFLKFLAPVNKKIEFIVDRRTLRAGFGTQRMFQCFITEIKQQNLI